MKQAVANVLLPCYHLRPLSLPPSFLGDLLNLCLVLCQNCFLCSHLNFTLHSYLTYPYPVPKLPHQFIFASLLILLDISQITYSLSFKSFLLYVQLVGQFIAAYPGWSYLQFLREPGFSVGLICHGLT